MLDCGTQPGQCLPQVLVLYLRQGLCDAADRLPSEKAIDPLENDGRQMLDFKRCRAFDAQNQGGGCRRFFADRTRPADLEGLAVGGDFTTNDVRPARYARAWS